MFCFDSVIKVMIIGNLCKEMLSWRGVATLVPFLLLPTEAFDPDLKTPLDQYANANCEAGGMSTDYDYYSYDDDQDRGNYGFLDKTLELCESICLRGISPGATRRNILRETTRRISWKNI